MQYIFSPLTFFQPSYANFHPWFNVTMIQTISCIFISQPLPESILIYQECVLSELCRMEKKCHLWCKLKWILSMKCPWSDSLRYTPVKEKPELFFKQIIDSLLFIVIFTWDILGGEFPLCSISLDFNYWLHQWCFETATLSKPDVSLLYAVCTEDIVKWALKIVYHDDIIKWKHFPRYWPFVRGIHRSPVNFPHKGQWRGALMFSLICTWINDWVNNREAGDLSRYQGHYDVIVMITLRMQGVRIKGIPDYRKPQTDKSMHQYPSRVTLECCAA